MSFVVNGAIELAKDFEKIAALPQEVVDDMLTAEATVVVAAEKKTALAMLRGPYRNVRTGVAQSIRQGQIRKSRGRSYTDVIFEGTQHGERLAAIAYINEFGKLNQPARPFIAAALIKCTDEAVDAAAKIYDDFCKQNNL